MTIIKLGAIRDRLFTARFSQWSEMDRVVIALIYEAGCSNPDICPFCYGDWAGCACEVVREAGKAKYAITAGRR